MDASASKPATFLVFGDLHGRILPAFRFASWWSARTGCALAGLLQVGDLGYFPDLSRCDKATLRHAKDDPLELGALDVAARTDRADRVFDDPHCSFDLWFTAGNHEDFDELERFARAAGKGRTDFAVVREGFERAFRHGVHGERGRQRFHIEYVGRLWILGAGAGP